MKTEEEIRNDIQFQNRRKMAFYSIYAVLFVTISVTLKILIIPTMDVNTYTPVLNWGLSVLGGVILAYIGASSFEQIKTFGESKTDGKTTTEIKPKPTKFEGN